jgi:hypothetical protein
VNLGVGGIVELLEHVRIWRVGENLFRFEDRASSCRVGQA